MDDHRTGNDRTGTETALWAWFLFGESGLPTQRAKALLAAWTARGLSLQEALARLPQDALALGLTPAERAHLQAPPQAPPAVTAMRWDDPRYPPGLEALPLKRRPALLFYEGEPDLLARPLIYLAPGELDDVATRKLREVISLLIGEDLLLSFYEDSPQGHVLFEEMAYGSGEALLFARAGLEARSPSDHEQVLLADNRLLVVSPLPSRAPATPGWDGVLQEVAMAAAERALLSGAASHAPGAIPGLSAKPTLSLSPVPTGTPVPSNVELAEVPADVLPWIDRLFTTEELELVAKDAVAATTARDEQATEAADLGQVDLGPPPSPEEILETLSKGGTVPDSLRRRLLGNDAD